jgi:hypothetical protein
MGEIKGWMQLKNIKERWYLTIPTTTKGQMAFGVRAISVRKDMPYSAGTLSISIKNNVNTEANKKIEIGVGLGLDPKKEIKKEKKKKNKKEDQNFC